MQRAHYQLGLTQAGGTHGFGGVPKTTGPAAPTALAPRCQPALLVSHWCGMRDGGAAVHSHVC